MEGGNLMANLGRNAPRECEVVSPFVIARSTLVRRSPPSGEGGCDEAIHPFFMPRYGLLRGACHRARIRATRWLAMTVELFEIELNNKHARRPGLEPGPITTGRDVARGWSGSALKHEERWLGPGSRPGRRGLLTHAPPPSRSCSEYPW